jgi:hypothetical protein
LKSSDTEPNGTSPVSAGQLRWQSGEPNFGEKNQTVVTVLAVRPPEHLPAGSDLNALGIAIAASHFTVTDGHVTREVSGRQLVMESTSTL